MAAPIPFARPTTALYVGNLHPDATEAMLWDAFGDVGPIRNVRICQDANTKRSLGYAYVNFVNAEDAERAMDTKANVKILDQPCRVMWPQRDPALRSSGVGNLFVKNLAPTVDQVKLLSAFSPYGNILSCEVMMDDQGQSKGFGFVHLESAEAAQQAVDGMNGTQLDGQTIYVGQHLSREPRAALDVKWTKVFVKHLPGDFDETKLKELFAEFGTMTGVFLSKHMFSIKSTGTEAAERCFGFVNFSTHEEAVKAVEKMNDHKLGEHTLFVGRAATREEHAARLARNNERREVPQSNVYVKHLEEGITKEILEEYFSKFGTITSAQIALDSNGQPRGFGFVNFTTAEAAQKAIADASNQVIPGFSKPLFVGLFEPRSLRGPRIAAQKAIAHHQQMFSSAPPHGAPTGSLPSKQDLTAMHPFDAQTAIGDFIFFSLSDPKYAQHKGKMTGMLLAMYSGNLPDLIDLAHAPTELQRHIDECYLVLTELLPSHALACSLPSKQDLTTMPPTDAEAAIGDFIFNSLSDGKYGQLKGEITDLILDRHSENLQDLIDLVHAPTELQHHIDEAYLVLAQHYQDEDEDSHDTQ